MLLASLDLNNSPIPGIPLSVPPIPKEGDKDGDSNRRRTSGAVHRTFATPWIQDLFTTALPRSYKLEPLRTVPAVKQTGDRQMMMSR